MNSDDEDLFQVSDFEPTTPERLQRRMSISRSSSCSSGSSIFVREYSSDELSSSDFEQRVPGNTLTKKQTEQLKYLIEQSQKGPKSYECALCGNESKMGKIDLICHLKLFHIYKKKKTHPENDSDTSAVPDDNDKLQKNSEEVKNNQHPETELRSDEITDPAKSTSSTKMNDQPQMVPAQEGMNCNDWKLKSLLTNESPLLSSMAEVNRFFSSAFQNENPKEHVVTEIVKALPQNIKQFHQPAPGDFIRKMLELIFNRNIIRQILITRHHGEDGLINGNLIINLLQGIWTLLHPTQNSNINLNMLQLYLGIYKFDVNSKEKKKPKHEARAIERKSSKNAELNNKRKRRRS